MKTTAETLPEDKPPYWGKVDAVCEFFDTYKETRIGFRAVEILAGSTAQSIRELYSKLEPDYERPSAESEEPQEPKEVYYRLEKAPTSLPLNEEKKLVMLHKAGDKLALEALMQAYLPIIQSMAKFYAKRPEDVEDLVQEGCVSFLVSLDKFDPEGGLRLVGYVLPSLYLGVAKASQAASRTVRLPFQLALRQENPTSEMELDMEEVADPNDPEEEIERREVRRVVFQALETIKPREKRVLMARPDNTCRLEYLRELGEELGVSGEMVRKIEKEGRNRVRRSIYRSHRDLVA